jgi:hypothetical protein
MASSEPDIQFEELLTSVIEATNRHELEDATRRVDKYYLLLEGKIREPSGLDYVEQKLRSRESQIIKRISAKQSRWNAYRNLLEARLKGESLNAELVADIARDELSSVDATKTESIREMREAREALARLRITAARSTKSINNYRLQSHDRLLLSTRDPLCEYHLWKTTVLWLPKLTYLCVVFVVFVIGLTVVGSNIKSIELGLFLAISAWTFQEFIFVPCINRWLEKRRKRSLLNALAKLRNIDRSLCMAEAMLDNDLRQFY